MRSPVINGVGLVSRCGFNLEKISRVLLEQREEIFVQDEEFVLPYEVQEQYRNLSWCAQIGVNSAIMAYQTSCLRTLEYDPEKSGTYCGTQFGGIYDVLKMQCEAIKQKGPRGILPGMSIHSGYHITADIIALTYHLQASNITMVSRKLASGMAAVQAYEDIQYGVLDHAFVTGTDAVSPFFKQCMKSIEEENQIRLMKSGACTFILSRLEEFLCNENTVYLKCALRISSQNYFIIFSEALERAGILPSDISKIISTEDPYSEENARMITAIRNTFPSIKAQDILYTQSVLGNVLGASSAFGIGVASNILSQTNADSEIRNVLIISEDGNQKCVFVVGLGEAKDN